MIHFDPAELMGLARTHLAQFDSPRFSAHPDAARAFYTMKAAAAKEGFDLRPFSAFRDFDSQLQIWNLKYSGQKPLYDKNGKIRDFTTLKEDEVVAAILGWTALPGASRHHWGSDIDVVDAAATPGYRVKLLPEEVAPGGMFFRLHQWLDENIARFGFFRPYNYFCGGMYPEPWHLSHAPTATNALEQFKLDDLKRQLELSETFLGKDLILKWLPEIFQRHVVNIVSPDAQRPVALEALA